MKKLRLFIWEGSGVSSGYHDDGTLVVLATSAKEAIDLTRQKVAEIEGSDDKWEGHLWDLDADRLDDEPTRVLDIDAPTFVVFNGGGYD